MNLPSVKNNPPPAWRDPPHHVTQEQRSRRAIAIPHRPDSPTADRPMGAQHHARRALHPVSENSAKLHVSGGLAVWSSLVSALISRGTTLGGDTPWQVTPSMAFRLSTRT